MRRLAENALSELHTLADWYDDALHTLERVYMRCSEPGVPPEQLIDQIDRMVLAALTDHGDDIEALRAARLRQAASPMFKVNT